MLCDLAGRETPDLEAGSASVQLPAYEVRRTVAARDPLAVIDAYKIQMQKLAFVLGLRTCSICPRCNETDHPCQDKFGSNMRPLGGFLGAGTAFGAATEHQGHGTPHGHGEYHGVCIYQYGTLQEIADKIANGLLQVQEVLDYQAWMHREDSLVPEQHEEFLPRADSEWRSRYASREHDSMCQVPSHLSAAPPATAWTSQDVTLDEALAEGQAWKDAYFKDVQFIFSRVQHHVHKKTSTGYVPLKGCLSKHGKKGACKAQFPKEKLLSRKMRVVCKGLAKKLGLRVSGRRNAFGLILGKRRCMWQSGTTPGFAAVFRSNTHTQPNHRLPIIAATHDSQECKREQCLVEGNSLKKICKIAQRAQRNATGYYCGYTFKAQVAGKKELSASA